VAWWLEVFISEDCTASLNMEAGWYGEHWYPTTTLAGLKIQTAKNPTFTVV